MMQREFLRAELAQFLERSATKSSEERAVLICGICAGVFETMNFAEPIRRRIRDVFLVPSPFDKDKQKGD